MVFLRQREGCERFRQTLQRAFRAVADTPYDNATIEALAPRRFASAKLKWLARFQPGGNPLGQIFHRDDGVKALLRIEKVA
jgi:hypothetical protein